MKTITACSAIVLALTAVDVSAACAQNSSTGQKPCAQPGDPSKTLSEKLDQGGGVICPPDRRSGHQSAGAGHRQNAGDPAAR
jgi:hypothetical protein